jgi:hypothetical protein
LIYICHCTFFGGFWPIRYLRFELREFLYNLGNWSPNGNQPKEKIARKLETSS